VVFVFPIPTLPYYCWNPHERPEVVDDKRESRSSMQGYDPLQRDRENTPLLEAYCFLSFPIRRQEARMILDSGACIPLTCSITRCRQKKEETKDVSAQKGTYSLRYCTEYCSRRRRVSPFQDRWWDLSRTSFLTF